MIQLLIFLIALPIIFYAAATILYWGLLVIIAVLTEILYRKDNPDE